MKPVCNHKKTQVNLKLLKFNERENNLWWGTQKICCSCGNVKIRNSDTQYISYLQSNDTKCPHEMMEKQGDKEIM